MTTPVQTSGFVVPPNGGQPAVSTMAPGFVPSMGQLPPIPEVPATPAAAPAVAAPAEDATAALVAQLTAALASKEAAPEPAAVVPAESLNALDPSKLEDPTLRSMATAFKMLGADLDIDRIFGKAIDAGDPKLLDLAYLREKAGANADGLVGLAESIVQYVELQAEKSEQAVYALAGGEAEWNAASAAFNTSAPKEFKMVVVKMLDSGNTEQVQAAAKLVVQFAKGQGYVPNPGALLTATSGAPTGSALSKADFQIELQKLNPNDRDYQNRRGELFARRAIGKSLGK